MLNERNERIKIPAASVVNKEHYPDKENLIICNTCKNVAIKPYFCESCNVVFCKFCIEDLKTTNCPLCTNALTVCTQKYFDYFKDLSVKCPKCEEKIQYNDIMTHICNNPGTPTSMDKEDVQLINGVICIKCTKCNKYVPYSEKFSHQCKDTTSVPSIPTINVPGTNITLPTFPSISLPVGTRPKDNPEIGKLNLDNKPQLNDISVLNVELIKSLQGFMNKIERSDFNQLIQGISLLNTSINNLTKLNDSSYCLVCKAVGKLFTLAKCDCCHLSCCTTCCTPCEKCNKIFSKKCLIPCKSCNLSYCPHCEFDQGIGCLCVDTKYCRKCLLKPNVYGSLSMGLLNTPHLECKYLKMLDNNVFVMRFLPQSFQCDILLNSQRQLISIGIIKDNSEIGSKIFQININDKITVMFSSDELKIADGLDYWNMNLPKADYIVFNFNTNPNYSYMLNKLNNSNFEELPSIARGSTLITGGGVFGKNVQLINNVQFKKLIN
jgi:hypothetical protein